MKKGIIYYTDNELEEPIFSVVQNHILQSGLPIVSCSLKPMDFGKNIVVDRERGFITYLIQIKTALENSDADFVFFCEHDVLYPKSHFDLNPLLKDLFHYNSNVWRWKFGSETAITYDRLISLSGLCVYRTFALDHYNRRLEKIERMGWMDDKTPEPEWARKWGYEPGTKRIERGGFSEDTFVTWESKDPMIDIRHKGTISKDKVTLDSFKHLPINWREIPIKDVPGWDLKELFSL